VFHPKENNVKIAVLGSGGREHALALRLRADGHTVLGIPGSHAIGAPLNVSLTDHKAVCDSARGSDLVVVGPEAPLADGLADSLRAAGLPTLGPGKAGARLETSKAFAKLFMQRHNVATARSVTVQSTQEARGTLASFEPLVSNGIVIKFDGLAAGKGVFVCKNEAEALTALGEIEVRYGANCTLVLEERLRGREVSILALTDGADVVPFPPAQDHKRLLDGDQGPNTGGMGAYCPVPWCSARVLADIHAQIIVPTLRGLAADAIAFRGILFFGVMVTPDGPKLLEYNTRFGDPETQALMPRVDGDLGALFLRTARGELAGATMQVRPGYSVAVVLAAAGYPNAPQKGDVITGLESATTGTTVVHAGTTRERDTWKTAGGRVLTVVGEGASFREARARAYEQVQAIKARGLQHRTDIAKHGEPRRIAILFSGRGSNMSALLESMRSGVLEGFATPALALTNRAEAEGIQVARSYNVPVLTLPSKDRSREDYDGALVAALKEARIDYIVLAGFMRILTRHVVDAFPGRILNIHPADTAKHQGLHGYAWAFENKLEQTHVTVHIVDHGLDTGPVILKAPVDLRGAQSLAEVEARGLGLEHQVYAEALRRVLLTEE
jgi:phosphoribosylamine---glycine ligase